MYLKKTKNRAGRVSLSAVHGFREDGGVRQRTIATFGYVDELARDWPDPIAHFTRVVAAMSGERHDVHRPQAITIRPDERVGKRAGDRKNVGCAVVLAAYNSLGIETALNNRQARSGLAIDLNAAMRQLVCARVLDPLSRRRVQETADRLFFRGALPMDDVDRALSAIAASRGPIVAAAGRGAARLCGRDVTRVHYDVTTHRIAMPSSDEVDGHHRGRGRAPAQTVRMGLLQDANAIPIDYRILSGDERDERSALDALAGMKRDLAISHAAVVVDPEVIDASRGLWRMEGALGVAMPRGASAQPLTGGPERVEVHFLIGYVVLMILRILQLRCERHHPIEAIADDLRAVSATRLEDEWWRLDHRSDLTDELFALMGADAPCKNMRLQDIKRLFARTRRLG